MSIFKKIYNNFANSDSCTGLVGLIHQITNEINAGDGAGNFAWENMNGVERMGKVGLLAEAHKINLNCVYNDKKNKKLIEMIRKAPLNEDEIMKLPSEAVYLPVIAVFIKEKESKPQQSRLGGRRRRRTKKRKSRRRRRKRTKKKRRRKSRKSRRRRRRR